MTNSVKEAVHDPRTGRVQGTARNISISYLVLTTTNPSFEQGGNHLVICANAFLSECQHISGAWIILHNETINEENIHIKFFFSKSISQQAHSYSCCTHNKQSPTAAATMKQSPTAAVPITSSVLPLLHP